ncbi:protein-L-isoaspartate O-methyltransferase family protein [Microvirga makkahensis]|uniref:Protein-L-isoaspartate O-methyltransferase n=1 Tax=Microvirga makkahensis TaxID=1128670 RepID=A0A7X3SR27_9HYPH|nr:SAM-dependent methyltransferase [Microvirga makkahensis]MXQ14117.1 SAM-dependent methyltransferase [Microvirga makkahensis]
MPKNPRETYRSAYAEQIARLTGLRDRRIELAFAGIPREDFLPPPPWTTISAGISVQTHDIAGIYDNVLVAIDKERGINNGEPALHAAWLDAVGPQPGETVVHVGAGTGYYTAILARLVEPGGHVEAFEYEADLAAKAERNLSGQFNVVVHAETAFGRPLPDADVIYVNAGVTAPDAEWLKALRPGGRLIFPWQPHKGWGPAVLVRRLSDGFSAKPLMTVGFISCSGAEQEGSKHRFRESDLAAVQSIWLTEDRSPDRTAIAVYDHVWFSAAAAEV